MAMEAAPWLEADHEFEGVGAHRLNPRYDPVDEPVPQDKVRLSGLPVPRLQMMSPVGLAARAVAPYRLDGHDGSHHQYDAGPVDITTLAANTWVLWWKATQSTSYTDPTFFKTWARRTLFRNRFAYHWLSSTTDVHQQADHFSQIVGLLGPGDGAMLDAEEGGITAAGCLAWCEAVEAVTHRPVSVYTGLYVSGGSIWKSDALRMSQYGPRAFHVAAYVTEENLRARIISTGSQNYPWQAWQFSSNGPVPGITGRADMNRVDDRGAYDLATLLNTPQPQPQPQPPLPPQGANDMAIATFEVNGLPGIYMWGPGMKEPVAFDNTDDLVDLEAALGAVRTKTPIDQEMYNRLCTKDGTAAQVGPLAVNLTLSGSASGTARPA